MRYVVRWSVAAVCCVCLVSIGCGGGVEEPQFREGLVPVSGKITVDGEAMAGVAVTFTPKAAGAAGARISIGTTDEQGQFTLYTPPGGPGVKLEDFPGALPGDYTVTFSRFVLPDGSPWDARTSEEGPMNVGATETMPIRVTNPNTSSHTATVPAGGTSSLEFTVETAK